MAGIADVQAVQDEMRAVKERPTKEAEVSEQLYGERIAKLEGSAEHWATKADVMAVLVEVEKVRTEVAGVAGRVDSVDKKVDSVDKKVGLLMWFMGIGVVVGLGFGGWIATLLSRLLAGGIP